ncbi:unnamed protein product [Mytilus edulis]|uniref:Death domain-containing protein n=1 Tax=Mytilus edulis TaxID=6550 RepID=A0A8S3Q4G7_MYTED|nr:unnamed protein product [Mytilus edulis]
MCYVFMMETVHTPKPPEKYCSAVLQMCIPNMYLINLLDVEEVDKVIKEFEDPSTAELLNNNKVKVSDCQGREAKMTIWGHPGNDVSGMISRSEKVAGTCEQLLGDEVYHYHGKLVTKEPFTGGAHLWHQDYGYWYINEFLEPNMITAFIALDKCEKRNGCLQIIESSHKCGRLDHKLEGQLTVTDPTRLDKIMDRFSMKYCLLNPGLPRDCLEKTPSMSVLRYISNHIGDSSLQLGIELGLDISEVQHIQHQFKDKLLDQTREILRRWKQNQSQPTVENLVKALFRIGKASCLKGVQF